MYDNTNTCIKCDKGYYYSHTDGYCYSTIFYNCKHWTGHDSSDSQNSSVFYPNGKCAECIKHHVWIENESKNTLTCVPDRDNCRRSIVGYEFCNKFVDLIREKDQEDVTVKVV